MATAVVVVVELLVILVFAICLQLARLAFETEPVTATGLALSTVWVIVGSVAFGGMLGSLFSLYVRYVGREMTVVLLALCAAVHRPRRAHELRAAAGRSRRRARRPERHGQDRRRAARCEFRAARCPCSCCSSRRSAPRCTSRRWRRSASRRWRCRCSGCARSAPAHGSARRLPASTRREAPLLWRALHLDRRDHDSALTALVVSEHPGLGRTAADADGRGRRDARARSARSCSARRSTQLREIGGTGGGLVVVSNREPWVHEYARRTDRFARGRRPAACPSRSMR